MISAIQTGVLGMEKASKMVDNAASDIANAATPPKPRTPPSNSVPGGDISRDAVNMIVGHMTYDANAKVIEVAARMVDEIV
jgi:flagellar hook protein FlgE